MSDVTVIITEQVVSVTPSVDADTVQVEITDTSSVAVAIREGVTDHAALNNLDFAQSGHTGFEAAGAASTALAAHVAASDPHTQYLKEADYTPFNGNADTLDNHDSTYFEVAGSAGAAVSAHVGQSNPHSQYLLIANYVPGGVPPINTRANILASMPTNATVAYCSDTNEMALWTGSEWRFAPLELYTVPNGVDIGLKPPMVQNDRSGYAADYLTDKTIYNSVIGGSSLTSEGAIRVSSSELQIYLLGAWRTTVTGFRFREDSSAAYVLEHQPVGFSSWIEIMSGNSSDRGLNSLPIVQNYQVSMGAYPPPQRVAGRTIEV